MKVAGLRLNIEGTDVSLKSLQEIRDALKEIKKLTGNVGTKGMSELSNAANKASKSTDRQTKSTSRLRKEQETLRQEANRLRRENEELAAAGRRNSDQYRENIQRLGQITAAQQQARNEARQAKNEALGQDNAYKALSARLSKLRIEYKQVAAAQGINSKESKELRQEVQKLDSEIKDIDASAGQFGRNVGNYSSAVDGLSGSLFDLVGVSPQVESGFRGMGTSALAAGAGIAGIVGLAGRAIKEFADLEDVMATTRKTTNLTADEVSNLKDQLFEIDTRTTIEDLLGIARGAGRLGVEGVDNLAEFTESVDKLQVAMGDDLGGTAEETATTIGKIVDIFRLDEEFGLANALERVGSVVNELANTTKGQAQPIIDFVSRLQGIASQANISVQELAALGATLDAIGQPTERSATAIQRFISRIADAPEHFADMAESVGFARDEFLSLTRSNPTEAILQVLEAGQSTEEGLAALKDITEQFGITSERERGVIFALSSATDQWRENIEGANTALEENISVQKEFEVQNNTTNAEIEKFQKRWQDLKTTIGGGLAEDLNIFFDEGIIGGFGLMYERAILGVLEGNDAAEKKIREFREQAAGDGTEAGQRFTEQFDREVNTWNPYSVFSENKIELEDQFGDVAKSFIAEWDKELNNWNPFEVINDQVFTQEDLLTGNEIPEFLRPFFNETQKGAEEQASTFKELEKEASNLESKIKELAASGKDYTDELRRYRQVQSRLESISKVLDVDGAKIGIPLLKEQISQLKSELESGAFKGESFIKEKTDELIELEERLEKAQRLLSIARQAAEFDPRSRVQPLENRELGADEDLVLEAITTDQEPLFGDPEFKISRDNLEKYKELSKEIHDDIAEHKVEKEKEAAELRKQINQELQQAAFSAAENAANSIFQIQRQMTEQRLNSELQAVENRYNREIEAAELNAARQEELEAELEEKREEINQEAAERNKRIAITEALINAALAITQSLANTTLPFPASLAGPAAIAVATGAQIAAIRKQEFAEGGMIDGPSHAQGGVPFTVQGRPGFEAEGGEYLIRKEVIASNQRMNVSGTPKEIAEAINNSMGKYKANMPFTFQTGGSIPVPDSLTTIASANRGMNISESAMQAMTDSVTKAVISGFERSKDTIREGTREGLILGADTVNRNAERQANLSQNTQG